jgi:hypothetical protein
MTLLPDHTPATVAPSPVRCGPPQPIGVSRGGVTVYITRSQGVPGALLYCCCPHPADQQLFRSLTGHYLPLPAIHSSPAAPPHPGQPACRVSAASAAALARGSAFGRATTNAREPDRCALAVSVPSCPQYRPCTPQRGARTALKLAGRGSGATSSLPTEFQREPSLGSQVPMLLLAVPAVSCCGPHPAVPPPRQPFRSRTSHYRPPPAAQSSSASPPAPRQPAYRVSAAYHAALARGGAQRRAGSCGRPRRWASPFLCPASCRFAATAPVALRTP